MEEETKVSVYIQSIQSDLEVSAKMEKLCFWLAPLSRLVSNLYLIFDNGILF